MSANATHIQGSYADALDAIYDRVTYRAKKLQRAINDSVEWSELPHTHRNMLTTMVSVADSIAQQDADGVLYDTARQFSRSDSATSRETWVKNVVRPVMDSLKTQDSFSATTAGVPVWYNAQRLTRELIVPQVPIERAGIGVMGDFDVGANSLYQDILEYAGRAGRIAASVGRPGGAARATFRKASVSTDLFWFGLEAVGTDFSRLENAYHGADEKRLLNSAIERGVQNTLDDIFFQGTGTGLKPYGIATHPAMLATVGDTISSSTTAVQIVNIIADGVHRMAGDTNGAAECKRVKIGATIWRRLTSVVQADSLKGALKALEEVCPGVVFERSFRLKDLESGVDGILYLADSEDGLQSIESAPMMFSWSEGPVHIDMVAVKSGGAYPQMPIYSRLDRHAVS